jgi:hypothetical protein
MACVTLSQSALTRPCMTTLEIFPTLISINPDILFFCFGFFFPSVFLILFRFCFPLHQAPLNTGGANALLPLTARNERKRKKGKKAYGVIHQYPFGGLHLSIRFVISMTVWMRSPPPLAASEIPGQRNSRSSGVSDILPGVYTVSMDKISFCVGPSETCGPYR